MPPTDLRPRASNNLAEHGSLPARAVEMPSSGAMVKPRWPIAPSQRTASLSPMARLARRDIDKPADTDDSSKRMINLMLTVLGLVFLALALTALLVRRRRLMRQRHQQQQQQQKLQQDLPAYNDVKQAPTSHGLTIETAHEGRFSILYIGRDGQPMLQNPNSPPHSPENVPKIHITFPDESDDNGRPQSGRVLVVRVGDNATVGLEPMHDEQLPAYEKEVKGQFQSIDMDQIGGLKEKDRSTFQ